MMTLLLLPMRVLELAGEENVMRQRVVLFCALVLSIGYIASARVSAAPKQVAEIPLALQAPDSTQLATSSYAEDACVSCRPVTTNASYRLR